MASPAATMNRLAKVDQPVLLVHGERDVLIPLSAARRTSSAHPEWRFEVAPDTGHLPMLEAPEWTSRTIDDWLDHQGRRAAVRASGPAIVEAATE